MREMSRVKEEELESSLKEREEELKGMKNKFEKEIAIYN